ncbi:endonuclease domain-containing protein [Dyella koreensis]|uniref:Endonuclease domain-containing protein n=1 Tax=Dyella koreensis TaxID=311235 RepID=A0ABW8KAZ7_9GAMM
MQLIRQPARDLRNNSTDAERRLWRLLQRAQLARHKFRRQHPLAGYIVDFVCIPARLVIELDGGQYLDAVAYDVERTARLERLGYRVRRFWNDDVLLRTHEVLEEIWRELEGWIGAVSQGPTPPQPSPVPRD